MRISKRLTFSVALLLLFGAAGHGRLPAAREASAGPGSAPLAASLSDGSHARLSSGAIPGTNLWNDLPASTLEARQGSGETSRWQRASSAWAAAARPSPAQRWWSSEPHAVGSARPDSAIRFSPTRAPPSTAGAAASPQSSIS